MYTVYGFCGESNIGQLRIDIKKESNANLFMDYLKFIENAREKSIQCLILDPPFFMYQAPGKNYCVWEAAIKKGFAPESIKDSAFFGKNHDWQKRSFELVEEEGIMISKREISWTNVLTSDPIEYHVHDSRGMAYIVRIDEK